MSWLFSTDAVVRIHHFVSIHVDDLIQLNNEVSRCTKTKVVDINWNSLLKHLGCDTKHAPTNSSVQESPEVDEHETID